MYEFPELIPDYWERNRTQGSSKTGGSSRENTQSG